MIFSYLQCDWLLSKCHSEQAYFMPVPRGEPSNILLSHLGVVPKKYRFHKKIAPEVTTGGPCYGLTSTLAWISIHVPVKVRWNYLFIPKLQRLHRWSLGMENYFVSELYDGCNYLSMLGFELIHVSKRPLAERRANYNVMFARGICLV